jgi:NlpC/P60 family putative phage cell wall peptidase
VDERALIVEEARKWLGTPFRHQGRLIGKACDCAGLVSEVGRALGLVVYEGTDYGRIPIASKMKALLDQYLVPVAVGTALDGDIYFMAWKTRPHHLAIKTPVGLIHAYESAGEVVEHPMDALWAGRIRCAYRYPGVN